VRKVLLLNKYKKIWSYNDDDNDDIFNIMLIMYVN